MKIQFKEWECDVQFAEYANHRTAIQLYNTKLGPIATATINIPNALLKPDEVIIKDYAENEGMLNTLIQAGIVEDTGELVHAGYLPVPVCRLLVDPNE